VTAIQSGPVPPPAAALSGAEVVYIVQNGQLVSSTVTAIAAMGGGGSGANPTATAGPNAVNGVASTFMRSDAAPAVQLGSNSQPGIVQVDGTTITASGGVISSSGGPQTFFYNWGQTTSSTTPTGNCAGIYIAPTQAMTLLGLGVMMTTVTSATYQLFYGPFNSGTSKLTGAPTAIGGVFTETAGVAKKAWYFSAASPISLSVGTTYLFFVQCTSSTSNITLYYNNNDEYIPGLYMPNNITVLLQKSGTPGTGDAWSTGGGIYSFSFGYHL
jgi:hypothetical protein